VHSRGVDTDTQNRWRSDARSVVPPEPPVDGATVCGRAFVALNVVKRRVTHNNNNKVACSKNVTFNGDVDGGADPFAELLLSLVVQIRYDTIRDAILTCVRKPT